MNRIFIALAALAVALPLDAQLVDLAPSRHRAGRISFTPGLLIAQPVGEFRRYVNAGIGFGSGLEYALDHSRAVSIRGDLGFLVYGSETQRVPLSPSLPRIRVDLNTTNNIFIYSIGPQLMVPRGPVRPYVQGFIGGAYFNTASSIDGTNDYDDEDYFSTQHYGDGILSYGGAGGIFIPVATRRTRVAIDLGVRYHRNGTTRYLTEGDIRDNPDGSLSFTPKQSETNMWVYRIGVSISPR